MTTGAEFSNFTNKRLVSFQDLAARTVAYFQELHRENTAIQFSQGAFNEKIPMDSPGPDQVRLNVKPTVGDYLVHDGNGHILDLQTDNVAIFENAAATTYEVGAGRIDQPVEIDINPRTGKPDYDHYVEAVGDEAEPNSVTDNGSNITFRVDSLIADAAGESLAGRTVRVFKKIPADGATTAAVAIEELVVVFGGAQNTITTSGLLGQTTVSTTTSDYLVQLVGLSVRRNTNPVPISTSPKHFFAGTVLGNGGTPTAFDISNQFVAQADSAGNITTSAKAPWADGTTNPASNVQADIEKIISDLTSTSGARGTGKLTSPTLTGTPFSLAAPRADEALQYLTDSLNEIAVQQKQIASASGQTYSPSLTNQMLGALQFADLQRAPTAQLWTTPSSANGINSIAGGYAVSDNQARAVAVGQNGAIYRLGNTNKFVQDTPGSSFSGSFNKVISAGANFRHVALGVAGEIQTGIASSWTRRLSGLGVDFLGGAYDPNADRVVGVGQNATIYESTSKFTWNNRSSGSQLTGDLRDIVWANALGWFIVVGPDGIQTSADGITWVKRDANNFNGPIIWIESIGYAVVWSASGSLYASNDGITWTDTGFTPSVNPSGIVGCAGGLLFVSASSLRSTAAILANGIPDGSMAEIACGLSDDCKYEKVAYDPISRGVWLCGGTDRIAYSPAPFGV